MLSIQAIGNICQDATIKEFNGQKFFGFTVAVDEDYTDKNGNRHEKTVYISCLKPIFNDRTALGQYLKRGVKVYINGTPSAKGFATQDGNIGGGLNCKVGELELLSSAKRQETAQAAPQTSQVVSNQSTAQNGRQRAVFPQNPAPTQPQYQMPLEKEDDLPF